MIPVEDRIKQASLDIIDALPEPPWPSVDVLYHIISGSIGSDIHWPVCRNLSL